jgi:hypothetical protein
MTTPSKQPADYSIITQYGPWIVLAVVLTGAAQFDSTAQLAAAFAYLILVAAALWYGPVALTNINGLTKGSTPNVAAIGASIGSSVPNPIATINPGNKSGTGGT